MVSIFRLQETNSSSIETPTTGTAKFGFDQTEKKFYTIDDTGTIQFYLTTAVDHNDLSGKQGGTTDEYYHLTSADYSALTDANAQLTALHTDGSPEFVKISVANYAGDFSQIAVYDASISTFTKGCDFYVDETNGVSSTYYAGDGAGGINGSINFTIKDSGASYDDSITTTGDAFNISASALTTGNLLNVASSQSSTSARTLLNIENINAGATGTTLLKINNNSTGLAVDCTGDFELDGGFILNEVASSPVSPVAGKGVLWVRNDTPNALVFTDDAGTDYDLTGDSVVDTLAEVLAVGNTTGGNDIILSGTDSLSAIGSHSGTALSANGSHTTSSIISLSGPLLTTGLLANFTSSSSDASTRNLIQIQNLDSGSTGTTPLYINQLANNTAVNILASGVTDTYALNVEADGLILEGSIARFYSNSSNTQTRDLVYIQNDNVNATEATCLAVYQKGDAPSIYVDSDGTTSLGLEIEGHSLTTGKLAKLHSTSSDASTRNLVEVINDSPSATGATTLYVRNDANNQSLDIDCTGLTSSRGVNIEANSITTGQALRVYSNSSDASTRVLTYLVNDNAAASGARLLQMQQDANAISWYLDQNGDGNAIYLDGTGNVTQDCISVIANNLTSASMARFYSNSASTTTRNLMEVISDNSAAVNSTNLYLQQDAASAFALLATGTNARTRLLTDFEVSRTTVSSSTYDIVGSDNVVLVSYTDTGTATITIPTAQVHDGRILNIKDSGGNATANNITIQTGGSETIDGSSTFVINVNYQSVTLVSDGNDWFII